MDVGVCGRHPTKHSAVSKGVVYRGGGSAAPQSSRDTLRFTGMWKSIPVVVAGAVLILGSASAVTTTKKTTKKSGTSKTTAAHKTSSTAAKKGSKSSKRTVAATRTPRQLTPTPDRYKQIQDALASKGYLSAEQANGQWGDASSDALKRFQTDQNLDASGKINSLSLIALGLGPSRETASRLKTPAPSATPATP